jgi:hypothetical protein
VFNFGLLCYTMQSEETKDDDSKSDSHTPKRITPKLGRLKRQIRKPVHQTFLPRGDDPELTWTTAHPGLNRICEFARGAREPTQFMQSQGIAFSK